MVHMARCRERRRVRICAELRTPASVGSASSGPKMVVITGAGELELAASEGNEVIALLR